MNFTTIDSICKRTLLERGMPIHYYAEVLFHATSCLRQLAMDTLKLVNAKNLPLNDYNAVDLPDDFVDDVAVCIPSGQYLQRVAKNSNITPLRIIDSTGSFQPYAEVTNNNEQTFFGFGANWFWFWNVSDYGEPTGRFFGAGGGSKQNGYAVFKERRQIQLTETFTSDSVVVLYISDGQNIDNATQVDVLAFDAIQAYINWQKSPNRDNLRSPEGMKYTNEKRKLRARLNDLTVTDIKDIIRKNFVATIKN